MAALKANRCRAWTTDSNLQVFGHDFLPQLLPQALFDTAAGSSPIVDQKACNKAFDEFENVVDRAKKAIKDAQELLASTTRSKPRARACPPR